MKLTTDESTFLDLIRSVGGSYCPGADSRATPEVLRLIRRLERRGLISVESTDDGFRYTVKEVV